MSKGDSLCLFCASRLLRTQYGTLPTRTRILRRPIHSRPHLSQASQAVARAPSEENDSNIVHYGTHQETSRGWTRSNPAQDNSSGGWGSGETTAPWVPKAKVLGAQEPATTSKRDLPSTGTKRLDVKRLQQTPYSERSRTQWQAGKASQVGQIPNSSNHSTLDSRPKAESSFQRYGSRPPRNPSEGVAPNHSFRRIDLKGGQETGTADKGESKITRQSDEQVRWRPPARSMEQKSRESTEVFDQPSRRSVRNELSSPRSTSERGGPSPITSRSQQGGRGPAEPMTVDSGRMSRFHLGSEQSQDRNPQSRKGQRKGRFEQQAGDEEISEAVLARMERRAQRKADKAKRAAEAPPTPIILPDFISVGNLAAVLRVRSEDFANKLQDLGFDEFSNDHVLGAEDAGLIAREFNFEPTSVPEETIVEDIVAAPEPLPEDKEFMLDRPPVITIMGHVDHGKTTLLDFLRKSSVAAGEHGGITQHIGAFTVKMSSGRTITFLDTPGHSAFLEMRQRGANVTDIVILVVAADDSVKPQTLEAIKHAQSAGVPMIVAVSKVDKEAADPDRVKRDLAKHGVEVEDFGGDVQAIPVSGKTGAGMEDLEDAAIALADILDVRADSTGNVEGWVLESKMKPSGRVATVLMRRGTLKTGTILVAGTTWTKVRTLRNEAGQLVDQATPGQPVEVDGWDDTPDAGAEALEAPNMQRAREVCDLREDRLEAEKLAANVVTTNELRVEHRAQHNLARQQARLEKGRRIDKDQLEELEAAASLAKSNKSARRIQAPIIVRGDVAGSVEAVSAAIRAMGNNEIRPEILREEVGSITESDVELAAVAEGVIVSFGLSKSGEVERLAGVKGVKILSGNVIYRVTEDVKSHLEDLLPPIRTTRVTGEADVAQVFEYKIKGRGNIPVAGCRVTNGLVQKGKNVKIFRGGEVVYDGTLTSLKNHKKDVDSMQKGTECGVGFENFTGFEAGDKLQAYEIHEEKRKL